MFPDPPRFSSTLPFPVPLLGQILVQVRLLIGRIRQTLLGHETAQFGHQLLLHLGD
jgi:hypothetical protein